MRIRTLSRGAKGHEVQWLKSWLNVLVVPSPGLKVDMKFDDATAAAVLLFKLKNSIMPLNGVADSQVYAAIWQKSTFSLSNTSMFGSALRFDRMIFLDHFLQSFNEVNEKTVPRLLNFLGKIEWDTGFQAGQIPWVAYMLATAWWETGRTFAPVAEGGCNDKTGCSPITNKKTGKVNARAYGQPTPCPNLAKKPAGHCPADPTDASKTHTYYGRGYVQLTHFSNYSGTSQELHRRGLVPADDHLVHFPEKVMDEDLAYIIISVGLRDGKFFTSQPMSTFINPSVPATPKERFAQYKHARHLVNGTDHDEDIADIAVKFESILNVSQTAAPHWSTVLPPAPPPSLQTPSLPWSTVKVGPF
jgi:putative chitinase